MLFIKTKAATPLLFCCSYRY